MRYVVGLKDSASARAALRWAAQHAKHTGADVRVLTVFQVPVVSSPEMVPQPNHPAERRADALDEQAELIDRAVARWPATVRVSSDVLNGDPVAVLVGESEEADLVVIGTSRRGRLHRLFHRSVARVVARRTHCPVALVAPDGGAILLPGHGREPAGADASDRTAA